MIYLLFREHLNATYSSMEGDYNEEIARRSIRNREIVKVQQQYHSHEWY